MTRNVPALVNKHGEEIRKGRISPALQTAVTLIVHEGLSIEDAAHRVDMRRESLSKALKKPHVRAFMAGVKRAWLDSRTRKAWLTVAELADNAGSEKVKLEAAKTILSAAGELAPEGEEQAKATTLIQFIKQEFHAQQPLTQRLPGVVEVQDYQDADYEPLDHDDGLTPGEEP